MFPIVALLSHRDVDSAGVVPEPGTVGAGEASVNFILRVLVSGVAPGVAAVMVQAPRM
jgi:hypothetical protein